LYFAELIGLFLVGYGIWFASKGVQMALGIGKDWWRPLERRKRYPYPVAGVALGVCFAVLGLRFALNRIWAHVQILSWVGGGLFILVLVVGIIQPRFLHPRWYGRLEDRYGREAVAHLKQAAHRLEDEQWIEVCSTDEAFDWWARQAMSGWTPSRVTDKAQRSGRAYTKDTDRNTHK
jgi:hypothetical protein